MSRLTMRQSAVPVGINIAGMALIVLAVMGGTRIGRMLTAPGISLILLSVILYCMMEDGQ